MFPLNTGSSRYDQPNPNALLSMSVAYPCGTYRNVLPPRPGRLLIACFGVRPVRMLICASLNTGISTSRTVSARSVGASRPLSDTTTVFVLLIVILLFQSKPLISCKLQEVTG